MCERTEHALGTVQRSAGESVRGIVDWHPAFAFAHTFHVCMERTGRLPTYGQFRDFALEDELGRRMLGDPAKHKLEAEQLKGVPRDQARAAMRWRVGNAYYGFLREVYTVVSLRSRGIGLEVHPVADALFRADAWAGRTVLSLRVGNAEFRRGDREGRKVRTEQLLADVRPALHFLPIELGAATTYGRVHLPSRDHLEAALRQIRQAGQLSAEGPAG
ncbi:hypothetical protein V1J52_16535 [Streptomyces sp. TRM 70351]|uniref:hypothetical protein n=1 Tax=Streptomyces sp. TRM 70351 TaxID=3116552 RepID=UPI002E7ABC25|nr:hypothetical protein [Streptomyces sp. TRM 70351]MEE1929775.1 hypothetical protein [Streptomyces sp. TRM 70351]